MKNLIIKLKQESPYKVFTMAKSFTKPRYIWRAYLYQGLPAYQLVRTSDFYKTRITSKEFTKAFNELEILGIHPKQESSKYLLFDFYTETLTANVDKKLKGLKKVRIVTKGKLVVPSKKAKANEI